MLEGRERNVGREGREVPAFEFRWASATCLRRGRREVPADMERIFPSPFGRGLAVVVVEGRTRLYMMHTYTHMYTLIHMCVCLINSCN